MSRSKFAKDTVRALGLLLGARGVLVQLVVLDLRWRTGELLSSPLDVILLVCWLTVANAAWQTWRTDADQRRAGVAAVAVLALVAVARMAVWASGPSMLADVRPVDRSLGRFPYDAGRVYEMEIAGQHTEARIGPDGTRVCHGGDPDAPSLTVALVGDSFVFGKGVADEDTLCAALARELAARGVGDVRLINLGHPGTNAWSYAEAIRFARRAHGADHVLVGVLFTNDALVMDLNAAHALLASRAGWLLSAVLDPGVLGDAVPVVLEEYTTGLALHTLIEDAVRALADASEDVPVTAWLYGNRGLPIPHQVRLFEEAAWTTPSFRTLGELTPPDVQAAFLEGDGHPSAAGNAWYAEQLVAHVVALRESP